jgi:signal recognition particle GTPase
MIKTRHGGDPAAVLYDAITAAKARKIDELLWTPPAACTPKPA